MATLSPPREVGAKSPRKPGDIGVRPKKKKNLGVRAIHKLGKMVNNNKNKSKSTSPSNDLQMKLPTTTEEEKQQQQQNNQLFNGLSKGKQQLLLYGLSNDDSFWKNKLEEELKKAIGLNEESRDLIRRRHSTLLKIRGKDKYEAMKETGEIVSELKEHCGRITDVIYLLSVTLPDTTQSELKNCALFHDISMKEGKEMAVQMYVIYPAAVGCESED